MSDDRIAELEKKINAFQEAFTQTTFTLISKMTEISDHLSRISAAAELLPKLKVQNAENNKFMQKLDGSLTSLMRRLDKLAMDGFQLPADSLSAPAPAPAPKPKPAPAPAPAPKPTPAPAPEPKPAPAPAPAPKPTPAPAAGAKSLDQLGEKEIEALEQLTGGPITDADLAALGTVTETPAAEPAEIQDMIKGAKEPAGSPSTTDDSAGTAPAEAPAPAAGGDLPALTIKDPSNKVQNYFLQLSQKINACTSYSEAANEIIKSKDFIANEIRFHAALFDMIKVSNAYRKEKGDFDAAAKRDVQSQIEDWYMAIAGA